GMAADRGRPWWRAGRRAGRRGWRRVWFGLWSSSFPRHRHRRYWKSQQHFIARQGAWTRFRCSWRIDAVMNTVVSSATGSVTYSRYCGETLATASLNPLVGGDALLIVAGRPGHLRG